MTTTIATTREQSARLLQCGVDPKTADMSWVRGAANVSDGDLSLHPYLRMQRINLQSMRGRNEITPAWSLTALLNLMPRTVTYKRRTNIFGLYHEEEKDGGGWNYLCPGIAYFIEDTPFEAVIKMIEWLTANNYKLNEL